MQTVNLHLETQNAAYKVWNVKSQAESSEYSQLISDQYLNTYY